MSERDDDDAKKLRRGLAKVIAGMREAARTRFGAERGEMLVSIMLAREAGGSLRHLAVMNGIQPDSPQVGDLVRNSLNEIAVGFAEGDELP